MLLGVLLNKIIGWFKYRETVLALSELTDHELKDLGINRFDIKSVARDAHATA